MVSTEERQTVAASYILTFYQEVQNLTHTHAQYLNILSELKEKYKDTDSASPEEKEATLKAAQMVRFSATKCYIMYRSISDGLKIKSDKVKKAYEKVKDKLIVNSLDLEAYVMLLNGFIVDDVIQSLLENSQQIVNEILKNDAAK